MLCIFYREADCIVDRERISVIIPTYRRCDGLIKSIESVLHQSYPNIEIIVVDDNEAGSPERQQVSHTLESYSTYENIKYIQHPCNKGGSAARNTGIRMATGSIITFLDDDDQYLEQYLEVMYNKMVQSNSKMVFLGNYYKFEGKYTYVKKRRYTKELYSIDDVLSGDCLISIFFMIRKDFIIQLGLFDESLRGYQDCDMWISATSQIAISVVDEPLAICDRDEGERVTSNISQREQVLDVLIEKWRGQINDSNKDSLELFYCRQKEEIKKQKKNELLFCGDKIKFDFLCRVFRDDYSRAQKVRILLVFLFGNKGQSIYKWLQFKVLNSGISFLEVPNER